MNPIQQQKQQQLQIYQDFEISHKLQYKEADLTDNKNDGLIREQYSFPDFNQANSFQEENTQYTDQSQNAQNIYQTGYEKCDQNMEQKEKYQQYQEQYQYQDQDEDFEEEYDNQKYPNNTKIIAVQPISYTTCDNKINSGTNIINPLIIEEKQKEVDQEYQEYQDNLCGVQKNNITTKNITKRIQKNKYSSDKYNCYPLKHNRMVKYFHETKSEIDCIKMYLIKSYQELDEYEQNLIGNKQWIIYQEYDQYIFKNIFKEDQKRSNSLEEIWKILSWWNLDIEQDNEKTKEFVYMKLYSKVVYYILRYEVGYYSEDVQQKRKMKNKKNENKKVLDQEKEQRRQNFIGCTGWVGLSIDIQARELTFKDFGKVDKEETK